MTLGSRLKDAKVVGDDGTFIGMFDDLRMNLKTGMIDSLLVNPTPDTQSARVSFNKTDGRYRIPCDDVKATGDRIVVFH